MVNTSLIPKLQSCNQYLKYKYKTPTETRVPSNLSLPPANACN